MAARPSVNDLWADAAAQLSDDDKLNINFSQPDKLNILAKLHADAETLKRRSIESRWKYTRRSGETVIIRDVFDKIVHWVDMFKQVGDVAIQYDPAHAALPWAGIRFLLQLATNDSKQFGNVIEGLTRIAELMCRYATIEALYLQDTLKAGEELRRAVVKLYMIVLRYLSKARQYFEQGSLKRQLKSAIITDTQLESDIDDMHTAEHEVAQWMALVDRSNKDSKHAGLVQLLATMDAPLRRIDDNFKSIQDNLEVSERTDILQWLSPERYIEHHNQAIRDVLTGTGQWLLSDPVFSKWKDESASSILWLHGTQGSGKSKLVSIVIEDALKSFAAGISPQPVFFYCSRNPAEPALSSPRSILASLARQLSNAKPGMPLLPPSVNLYRKEQARGFASGQLQAEDSCRLIMQLIALYPQTTIIIDALDECDPHTRFELLQALERFLQDSSSLVKIFVSSRDDQDIVLGLCSYPNLEIESHRNSADIAQFVKAEVERLIKARKLLRYSTSQAEMRTLIIDQVTRDAQGMFRWVSMQLQRLCEFPTDDGIRKALGKLPPILEELYEEIYRMLSTTPDERAATIFKNVLNWLLCAQETLPTDEFLVIISIDPRERASVAITRGLVLEICNNFVVFDAQLDTFRFAHLSVREFLQRRSDYDEPTTNSLIAEMCLWSVLSEFSDLATEKLFQELGWCAEGLPAVPKELRAYADIYWAMHCRAARQKSTSSRSTKLRRHFLSSVGDKSSLVLWSDRLPTRKTSDRAWNRQVYREMARQLRDTIPTGSVKSVIGFLVCCAFDFDDLIEDMLDGKVSAMPLTNGSGESCLHIAAKYGSCATLAKLLEQQEPAFELTEEVVKVAAANERNGKEVIALLLNQRSVAVTIREEVVKAAAANRGNGKEVMTLLLDRCGTDVAITEEVVKAAAANRGNGKEVMTLLLDRCGTDVAITEEVVKAAAANDFEGKEVMTLLLDRRSADVTIPEEVVKAAAANDFDGKEVMTLLLDRRNADVIITEEVVKAAAANKFHGDEVITLLLDRRSADVTITEKVVEAAAANKYNGKEVLAVLLDRRSENVTITGGGSKGSCSGYS